MVVAASRTGLVSAAACLPGGFVWAGGGGESGADIPGTGDRWSQREGHERALFDARRAAGQRVPPTSGEKNSVPCLPSGLTDVSAIHKLRGVRTFSEGNDRMYWEIETADMGA